MVDSVSLRTNHQSSSAIRAIIRNRRKIEAVIHNARLDSTIRTTQSFKDYLWQQLGHQQLIIQPPVL
ncbi:DNA-3-methyladenine glycosylase I [Lactiplantibacillus plantarum]|uniref:DNA-3-methyladenine glycosylase I n=1 Tax=Lactiplantibacillus plantarum TaxID=1590 RepID=UPI0029166C81|nr:DNA-3-methyladenine glycosylase I [Lactiplantibacillus plantarum]